MTSTRVHLWTVDDYHRMVETGILTTNDRVELLDGQILQMSPQRPPHAVTTKRTYDYLKHLLLNRADVRAQLPVTLSPRSEPEPDIAVVAIDPREYLDHHPIPEEIFLLIEVADTTLDSDLSEKAAIYAQAQIQEYWVLNLRERQVYVFREPREGAYQQERVLTEYDTISPLAFPEFEVSFHRMFPLQ